MTTNKSRQEKAQSIYMMNLSHTNDKQKEFKTGDFPGGGEESTFQCRGHRFNAGSGN